MKYVCQNCGDTVNVVGDEEPWDCVVCGGEVLPEDKSDVVPKDDLRELVEKWRDEIVVDASREVQAENRTYAKCADDLEELVEE